LVTWQ